MGRIGDYVMSQFQVLVVGPESYRETEDVLAPYDEHLQFPPYIKFNREDKSAEKKRLIKLYRARLKEDPGNVVSQRTFTMLLESSDEEYFDNSTRYYNEADLNTVGEPISTYNPNTKFNSWEYAHKLVRKSKQGTSISARKHDIDWNTMEWTASEMANQCWDMMQRLNDKQKSFTYGWFQGETRQQYINRQSKFTTHAYVLDGKWVERGLIGWWTDIEASISSEKWMEQFAEMLTSIKNDVVLSVVDCRV